MMGHTSAHEALAATQEITLPSPHETELLLQLFTELNETQREQILQIMQAFVATSR